MQFYDLLTTFADHFAHVAFPLTELFKKDASWQWAEVHESAVNELNDDLYSSLLALP